MGDGGTVARWPLDVDPAQGVRTNLATGPFPTTSQHHVSKPGDVFLPDFRNRPRLEMTADASPEVEMSMH